MSVVIANAIQAKLFGDELAEVLERYEARQITSGQVIERLVELARKMREARKRHEALGLSTEEVAFYDALSGGSDDWTADPRLAEIAQALVRSVKEDLSVDWTNHEATEAAIRLKIKHTYSGATTSATRRSRVGADRNGNSTMSQHWYSIERARSTAYWPDIFASELPVCRQRTLGITKIRWVDCVMRPSRLGGLSRHHVAARGSFPGGEPEDLGALGSL